VEEEWHHASSSTLHRASHQWHVEGPPEARQAPTQGFRGGLLIHRLYRHFDIYGRLLYVGISLCPIKRFAQHSGSLWYDEIAIVTIRKYPTEASARTAERTAIANENPVYNAQRAPAPVKTLGRKRRALRLFRTKAGKTCAEMSALLGLAASTWRSYENGHRQVDGDMAVKIEKVCGIDRAVIRPDLFLRGTT